MLDMLVVEPKVRAQFHARGQMAYHAGAAAEQSVRLQYQRQGAQFLFGRWRGGGGEIDLIMQDGDELAFIEVKQARTHAIAVERITARQCARIRSSATAFLATLPDGQQRFCRFDVALVDQYGQVELIRSAW